MPFLGNGLNVSGLIHPTGFYLIAFEKFTSINLYFIFLSLVYIITVLFNLLLIYVIASNRNLHSAKFLAVCNLAVIDVVLNSCTIPGMIKSFLVKDNFLTFDVCLLQMFTYYAFVSLESFALAVLAYDRLIAICFPLRQNSINTLLSMSCVVALTWSYTMGATLFAIVIIKRLSFCNSVRVLSYFCDYAPVFRLACNDNSLHWSVASFLSITILLGPFVFILLSYSSILVTVFRMQSVASRGKALTTCVEHLILVAVFYIPVLTIFTIGFYSSLIDPDQRVLCLSLSSCLPPVLNPIIYSFRTKEIRLRVRALFRRVPVTPLHNSEGVCVCCERMLTC
ncbi:olfactory receptor 6N1-like [Gadus morhua]|uniref:olfactory receptor 6N1-like n=1 Tax=Gadus morhua TaxID=8049 RepID=UPI0011B643B4|nr:olfactory receptor 6N1-like [Gadus morhua]